MEVFETGELNFTCTPTFLSLMEVFEADELGGDGGSMRRLQLLAARTSSGAAAGQGSSLIFFFSNVVQITLHIPLEKLQARRTLG